ncbi:MAG: glycosyltransferase [Clostridia bacterium]|nr:glycosyltransferase [Clostridia bacterium]
MNVFILTDTRYPADDAVTLRTLLVAKLFLESGHRVTVFSRTEKENGIYEGIPYRSLRHKGTSLLHRVYDYYFHFEHRFLKILKDERPDLIVFHTIPTGLLKKLIRLRKQYGFRLINDCVEWYSKEQTKPTLRSRLAYYTKDRLMRRILPRQVEIIAISRYIKDYFESTNTPCLYIPSVCDPQKISFQKQAPKDKVRIVYAGSPGRKDLFEPIINAIKKLSAEERGRLELQIIGANAAQIADNAKCTPEDLNQLSDCIHFLPRMSHTEVLAHLSAATFTILIRPPHLRYAKAGFPTKVPESLAAATPVICNLTSDLADFLTDGQNALIASSHETNDVYAALKRALALRPEELDAMYRSSRKTAEERFDYRLFRESLCTFAEKRPL